MSQTSERESAAARQANSSWIAASKEYPDIVGCGATRDEANADFWDQIIDKNIAAKVD